MTNWVATRIQKENKPKKLFDIYLCCMMQQIKLKQQLPLPFMYWSNNRPQNLVIAIATYKSLSYIAARTFNQKKKKNLKYLFLLNLTVAVSQK